MGMLAENGREGLLYGTEESPDAAEGSRVNRCWVDLGQARLS